ncbi:MAG: hypothetical protein JST08_21625 [Actinobacteria bacterium]|nr:hypothetical protein [Actinomycetota bacterium]
MSRRKVDVGAVVFALLVIATVAAFAYAQRVKRDPQVVDKFKIAGKHTNAFTPAGPCHKRIRLKFRTTTSNDATVAVIKPGGAVVRTLARDAFLKRYSYHTYHWDGTDDAGVIQPVGRYRLRVMLEDEGRSLTLPGTIRLYPKGALACGGGRARGSAGEGQSG